MTFFDNLTQAVRERKAEVAGEAEEGNPRAQRRVSAELVAKARQVERKPLPEPAGLLPSDEDQAAALAALAALFVRARESFDPGTADIPFLGKSEVEVTKSRPVRNDVPGSWSTSLQGVGADVGTLVGRNVTRASLQVLNRGTVAVLLSATPDGPTFEVAPAAIFTLDTTGAVYGRTADGSAQRVQVTQTFYGEAM